MPEIRRLICISFRILVLVLLFFIAVYGTMDRKLTITNLADHYKATMDQKRLLGLICKNTASTQEEKEACCVFGDCEVKNAPTK